MAKCALTKCCCLNLHQGTKACLIYVMFSSIVTATLFLLDLIDMGSTSFQMNTFDVDWRSHINDVMTALDVLMVFSHLFIFVLSIIAFHVSKNDDAKLNICMLLFYTVMMCLYILVDFAVNMYFFTWMNHNIWIYPYLCFVWIFWIIRFGCNIMVVIVTHSRIIDLQFQKKYDLLNMPGVNHSLSTASMLSGSMRSVHSQHLRASSQRLYASQRSLQQSQRSLNRSQQSLGRGGAANF